MQRVFSHSKKYCVLPGNLKAIEASWAVPIVANGIVPHRDEIPYMKRVDIKPGTIVTFLRREGDFILFRYEQNIVMWNTHFENYFALTETQFNRMQIGAA